MLGEQGLIDRDQFVRLIVESLYSLGYTASADVLEDESGIAHLSLEYHQLRNLIFSGQWEDCVKTIETKELFKDLEPERQCRACFLIWQPCFLEQLAPQDTDAIPILRHRIAPLAYGHREVHSLALSIITSDPSHKRELIQRRGELFKDVARNRPRLHHLLPFPIFSLLSFSLSFSWESSPAPPPFLSPFHKAVNVKRGVGP